MSEFEKVIQELKDAMTVTAAMSLRQEARIKEHEEDLVRHAKRIREHAEWQANHEKNMAIHVAYMVSIDEKIDKIAALILKRDSANGHS